MILTSALGIDIIQLVACEWQYLRGVAQPGSARALGAWGRGFKSLHPDSYYSPSDGKYGPVVKWPKTPPFHGGYSGSNPDGVILLLFPSVWAFSSVG